MRPTAFDCFAPNSILTKLLQAVTQGVALASLTAAAGCAQSQPARGDAAAGDPNPDAATAPQAGEASRTPVTKPDDPSRTPVTKPDDPSRPPVTDPPDASDSPDAIADGSRPTEPYPTSMLGCWGEDHDGGFWGQCCVEAQCYTPSAGEDCTSAVGARSVLPYFPPGSGDCSCLLGPDATASIAGPFAPSAGHNPRSAGECCYLVGSIECTGRPLMVGGQPVIAGLALRSDWAVFA